MSDDAPRPARRLRDDRAELTSTIDGVAERIGLNRFVVEKDYWVTEALRGIAREFDITFKGGTCLSKAYELTRRFSEDVDLLAPDPSEPGDSGKQIKKKREAVLKGIIAEAEHALGDHGSLREHGSEGKNRASHVFWDARFGLDGDETTPDAIPLEAGIRRSVLIEVRYKAGDWPSETRPVTSLLAAALDELGDIADYADLQPFKVKCVHPGRTAIEKLTIFSLITAETFEADVDRHRPARHLYDVHLLLQDESTRALLADSNMRRAIFDEHQAGTRDHGQELEWPDGGYHSLYLFNASAEHDALIDAALAELARVYLFDPDSMPGWAEIRAGVHRAGEAGLI